MRKLTVNTILALGFLALPACESIVHEPTHITQNRVQVAEEDVYEELALSEVDGDYIKALSHHYTSRGDGTVDLTVTYDPQSRTSSAMTASSEVARIGQELRENGVVDVKSNIMPVMGQGDEPRVIISYVSYNALAPKDCDVMPGFADLNVDHDPDYKIGCTVETLFARQIARPKDLQGRGQEDPTSDGRRANNIVEPYRAGIRNEVLQGESASSN